MIIFRYAEKNGEYPNHFIYFSSANIRIAARYGEGLSRSCTCDAASASEVLTGQKKMEEVIESFENILKSTRKGLASSEDSAVSEQMGAGLEALVMKFKV